MVSTRLDPKLVLDYRTYYSENPTADDLKLGEFMAKVMSDATDGGVEDSPDHYPDEETIKLSTPPTIYDAARHYGRW
ncbi:hypothetical protein Cantr_05718 [Candida viswanathii]|uniref:Uncharacterized protein n=1 Tax=Candida viswanathii TaxID=5486 RepID=A0A367XTY1_9ASCO|nr:hypothetical protein Cantr_05718 [Candida viswanathii]